jgi:hypothetical protein
MALRVRCPEVGISAAAVMRRWVWVLTVWSWPRWVSRVVVRRSAFSAAPPDQVLGVPGAGAFGAGAAGVGEWPVPNSSRAAARF